MITRNIERLAFSPMEVAQSVGLSLGTIRKLIKEGKLKSTRYDRKILISRVNLDLFLNQETVKKAVIY
jgi:excisionase family DNA binding protein